MACTNQAGHRERQVGQPEVNWECLLGVVNATPPRLVGKGPGSATDSIRRNDFGAGRLIGSTVNEVVPAAISFPRAEAILKQISRNAPLAVRYSLEAVNKGLETSQTEGLALEASFFAFLRWNRRQAGRHASVLEKRGHSSRVVDDA